MLVRISLPVYSSSNISTAHALPVLLGPDTSSTLQVAIEPLSNQACNVHLVVILLDRIVMALYPELAGTPSS